MDNFNTCRALLEMFIAKCGDREELPHHFDDTLVDKLLSSLVVDENCLKFVEEMLQRTSFETSTLQIRLMICFLRVTIQNDAWRDDVLLLTFVKGSAVLITQCRPAILLDSLFKLYQLDRVFLLQKSDAWVPTLEHSLSALDDDTVSLFLKREMQKFICKLSPAAARRLRIIPSVLAILKKKLTPPLPPYLPSVEILTRIVDHYSDELAFEEIEMFMEAVRKAGRVGQISLTTMIKLVDRHPTFKIPMSPGSWANEANRLDIACLIFADRATNVFTRIEMVRGDPSFDTTKNAVDMVIHSTRAEYRHIAAVLHLADEDQIDIVCNQTTEKVMSPRFHPGLVELLEGLTKEAPAEKVARIYESIGMRALLTPSILKALLNSYGRYVFVQRAEFQNYGEQLRQHISDIFKDALVCADLWEKIDTALMIANDFPCFLPSQATLVALTEMDRQSPYVILSAMRLLRDNYGGVPVELLDRCITITADPAPKLFCLQYLCHEHTCDGIEPETIVRFIEAALSDVGLTIREAGLKIAEQVLQKRSRTADAVREILHEYKTDAHIGQLIRGLLKEPTEDRAPESESVRILREMLTSLEVKTDAVDEGKDCY